MDADTFFADGHFVRWAIVGANFAPVSHNGLYFIVGMCRLALMQFCCMQLPGQLIQGRLGHAFLCVSEIRMSIDYCIIDQKIDYTLIPATVFFGGLRNEILETECRHPFFFECRHRYVIIADVTP
ncbi:hypothetical protein [Nonomuraea polychroma]|uniref:hypothetical protein n=1 Tax=Nonomuraea polychroma TaxID=46176 RepID=UPI000FDD5A3A|nr:hypothetical protein [Nonomuraea polychroma]